MKNDYSIVKKAVSKRLFIVISFQIKRDDCRCDQPNKKVTYTKASYTRPTCLQISLF